MMSSIGFIIQLKKVPIPLIMSMTENEILVQYKETIALPTFFATSTTAAAIACASRTNGSVLLTEQGERKVIEDPYGNVEVMIVRHLRPK
jgi:hypothetical protein